MKILDLAAFVTNMSKKGNLFDTSIGEVYRVDGMYIPLFDGPIFVDYDCYKREKFLKHCIQPYLESL